MGPWDIQRHGRVTSSHQVASRQRWTALALLLGACSATPDEVDITATGSSTGAPASSTSGPIGTSSTTASAETTGVVTGSATGDSGSSEGTTAALDGGSTSSDSASSSEAESTGSVSDVGCADDEREDLDPSSFPDIAACSGGFAIPGVGQNMPTCGRQGGDDGPMPDGLTCSIDDLCATGWHLCIGREEVSAMGISDCGSLSWSTGFYATAQSGEGSNTCDPTGTNDVFGCGDVGYTNISGCAPLNRSTGNLCVELAGPWSCPSAADEAGTLVKSGPDFGGALCCRD